MLAGYIIILIGIILLCIAGLLYLSVDYLNRRRKKNSEEENEEQESDLINIATSKPVNNGETTKPSMEEAKNLERAGRYENAAMKYEELKMWDKAGDCRRMLKTNYVVSANVNIGKVGTISMDCPYCGASQPIATKSSEVTCKFCGKNYVIPKKVLDLL